MGLLRSNRSLSTIISTLLLIVLAIAVASIVFASYRSIVEKEKIKAEFEKICSGIEIKAEAALTGINVINIGNENIEGVAVKKVEGEAEYIIFDSILKSGDINLVNSTNAEYIIPIFKNNDGFYICKDKSFAVL